MPKTNTVTLKQKIVVAIASCLAFCVMLAGLHLKDITRLSVASRTTTDSYRSVSEKATEDLHTHIDKQMVKAFAKTFGGDTILASRGRDDNDAFVDSDPGLLGRLSEALLLWRIFMTMPFSTLA